MATQTLDPQGNVVVNGFSTNQTPAQYSNSNIPVSSIAPATPLNLPQAADTTPIYNSAITNTQADIAGGLAKATTAADQAKAETEQARNQGVSLANLIAGAEAGNVKDVAGTYSAQGVNTLFNQLQDLNAQATGLKNEAAAIPIQNALNYQGSAGTQGQVTSVNRDQLSQNALKALSLGQQYAIAEGNYNKAKNYADQIIDTKYAAETARINALKTQQAALDKYVLTPAQAKELEATKRKTDLEAKILDEKIANDKEVSKLIVDASQFAPADVLQKARDIQNKGGTPTEVAIALGQYGADYMKNQLLKEQLKTEAAQRSKIYSDISVNNAQMAKLKAETGAITDPVTGASLKALTEGQAKDLTYAQRADQASPKLEELGSKIITLNPASFKTQMSLASSPLTSGSVSPEVRQYNQAAKNFLTATLRRESGATIAPSEFNEAFQIYIPFPGDDQATLQAKKQARETTIASFKGNVPGYETRIATPESSYLDSVTKSIEVVDQKTTPTNLYTSRLLGLPGVKP